MVSVARFEQTAVAVVVVVAGVSEHLVKQLRCLELSRVLLYRSAPFPVIVLVVCDYR